MSTGTESALAFKRLGGDRGDFGSRPRAPPMFDVLGFFKLLFLDGTEALETDDSRRSTDSPPRVVLADNGLPGAEDLPLPLCLGGWGNAPMLTVFRRDFPGGSEPTGPPSALSVGTDGEFPCFEPGR